MRRFTGWRSSKINSVRFWAAVTGSLGLLICGLLVALYSYTLNTIRQARERGVLSSRIIYYDEVLTMSARMAAVTGDLAWNARYEDFAPQLDGAIKRLISIADDTATLDLIQATNQANLALVEIETKALEMAKDGKLDQAKILMFSPEYEIHKRKYALAINEFRNRIESESRVRQAQMVIGGLIGILLFIILVTWVRALKSRIRREKEAEAARQKEMENIHQMAIMGECTGNICHEIATPLAAVSLLIETNELHLKRQAMKLDSLISVDKLNEHFQAQFFALRSMMKAVSQVEEIIKSTIDFYRNDGENRKVVLTELDGVLKEAIEYSQKRLRKSGVLQVDLQMPPKCEAYCQRVQLIQVLVNLIHNACDAIAMKNEKWIRVEVHQAENGILISVIDSGHGVPELVLAQIFDEGMTTKRAGQGTGLGLRISRGLVESWGGSLSYNQDSKNTRFDVLMPRHEPKMAVHNKIQNASSLFK